MKPIKRVFGVHKHGASYRNYRKPKKEFCNTLKSVNNEKDSKQTIFSKAYKKGDAM